MTNIPTGWKLVPVEPTPEILASAATAVWPAASEADVQLARAAAKIVLMSMDVAHGSSLDSIALGIATMAPAYRAMLAAAPTPPASAQDEIDPHDLHTSKGGRGYVAEFFAKHLRRYDFARYINEALAADFACVLAQHLSTLPAPAAGDARDLLDALKEARRELHACQAVIHLAGGFDPAYVTGAQAAIKRADAAIASQQQGDAA